LEFAIAITLIWKYNDYEVKRGGIRMNVDQGKVINAKQESFVHISRRNVDKNGRLVLPKELRAKLGIVDNMTRLSYRIDGEYIVAEIMPEINCDDRKVDGLGRIVAPKELYLKLGVHCGASSVDIYTDGSNLYLRNAATPLKQCIICYSEQNTLAVGKHGDKYICYACTTNAYHRHNCH